MTVCSAGKLFAVTGWRIGWAYGPSQFIEKMYSVCKCDTFGVPTILQVSSVENNCLISILNKYLTCSPINTNYVNYNFPTIEPGSLIPRN